MSGHLTVARVGAVLGAIVVGIGSFWAYQRGGQDFNVFYTASRLLLEGKTHVIYLATPDRFLYAPGFAWLMVPLAIFPFKIALAIWCALKIMLLQTTIKRASGDSKTISNGYWAIVLLAKPVLIDFQYGQINLILACVAFLALERIGFFWWFAAGVLAISKLILLPLGVTALRFGKRSLSGFLAGALVVLALPFTVLMMGQNLDRVTSLYWFWHGAILGRGFPTESHNQSFLAFLYHWFSGNKTHIVALHDEKNFSIGIQFSSYLISGLGFVWSLSFGLTLIVLLWRLASATNRLKSTAQQAAWIVSLLILPSYLIWKPYFVFGIPWMAYALSKAPPKEANRMGMIAGALLINCTGFDFIGYQYASWFEASAVLLWGYLIILFSTRRK